MKNRNILLFLTALTVLIVLSLPIESLVYQTFLHSIFSLCAMLIILFIIRECFKARLGCHIKKALLLCGVTLFLDLVVVNAIRFFLSNGVSTVLFLPVSMPICFLIIMHFSTKDTITKSRKIIIFLIGMILLLIATYLEILSFMDV